MFRTLFIILLIISPFIILLIINNEPTCKLNYLNSDEVYYIENFLSNEEFSMIKNICSKIENNKLKDEGFRKIYKLDNEKINNIFYKDEQIKNIESIIKNKIFKSDYPIEYRIYPEKSPGMRCHKDTILYHKPQYEVVYTITNSSDSYTKWYDKSCKQNYIFTKPNSLLIIKAHSNIHCVSKLNKGSRSILKLIYTQTHKINNYYKKEIKRFT